MVETASKKQSIHSEFRPHPGARHVAAAGDFSAWAADPLGTAGSVATTN
jgi:hypothetical protein